MEKYRYRIEKPHRIFEDAELNSERNCRENSEYNSALLKNINDAGLSFVKNIHISVSSSWYEFMVDTDKILSKEEISAVECFLGKDALCTDKFSIH